MKLDLLEFELHPIGCVETVKVIKYQNDLVEICILDIR